VWQSATGKLVIELAGIRDPIIDLQFSPKCGLLGGRTRHGTLIVWDVKTGAQLYTCEGEVLAFLSETQMATALDQTLTLREARTGKVLREHALDAYVLAFSPNGQLCVTVSDSQAALWEVPAGKRRFETTIPHDLSPSVLFSADQSVLALQSDDSPTGWILDAQNGEMLYSEDVHSWNTSAPPERQLILPDQTLHSEGHTLFYQQTPLNLQTNDLFRAVVFTLDSQQVIVGSTSALHFFGISNNKLDKTVNCPGITQMRFSPDGAYLVIGERALLRICHPTMLTTQREIAVPAGRYMDALAISPDGKYIAVNGELLRVWEAATGRLINTLSKGTRGAAFSPDARCVAAVIQQDGRATMMLWNSASGTLVKRGDAVSAQIEQLIYSPDGRTLLGYGSNGSLVFWDTPTGKVRAVIDTDSRLLRAAFSEDLLITLHDGWLVLWDAHSGAQLHSLSAHHAASGDLIVSPDGALIATCAVDGTVRLFGI
jgi:WD40 repeat protein